ncbi:D-TA family PLP-dependent enzyme [Maribacter sp. 2307ULW6-5]|uniref:D-TA family PLP-dependent enzyme n=1 Tax=Maribacter sp. 2307ULW6-5 TaxID=3386275 RepID=UPI0039BD1847
MEQNKWFEVKRSEDIISPALLVYPDRIAHNIDTMVRMAGGTEQLRPHVKTYKSAHIIELQLQRGIDKFKCATIAEAELLARTGAPDILLAMQPVGANPARFVKLMAAYPGSAFSTLVDNLITATALGQLAKKENTTMALYVDLNVGMHRTGIVPGEEALALYRYIAAHPHLEAKGLHAYDGHLRNPDAAQRRADCDAAFASVEALATSIEKASLPPPTIVAGGSPTFPFHAKRKGVIASPGTTLLWDAGYGGLFKEMDFLPAAVLFTRVISNPKPGVCCMDLGHKSLAPEMGFPRVQFLDLPQSEQIKQSEEHLVLALDNGTSLPVGQAHYAVPMHICPTVAKYDRLLVVEKGAVTREWPVTARNQKLNI